MIDKSLMTLFMRDIDKLYREIEAFENEDLLWKRIEGINNPSGNLALHLVGNLNTYIGRNLGNTGYVRDRPAEFSSILPKQELLKMIENTEQVVCNTLNQLSLQDFEKEYPTQELGYEMTTEYFLIHLLGHLNYHLGQINYHRRLIH